MSSSKMATKPTAEKSLTDLPSEILAEILARLPFRTLFVARSVCKTFIFLTTHNPNFINLHSSKAAQILAYQFGMAFQDPSYLLSLMDPELDYSTPQNSELEPLFQLPTGRRFCLHRPDFQEEEKFFLANSCNGLVYFFEKLTGDGRSLVCNPVTNEYTIIPEVGLKMRLPSLTKSMWLGFSPGINRYKVLSIFYWSNRTDEVENEHEGEDDVEVEIEIEAQVFVIGSDSWRGIDDTAPRRKLFWDYLCSTFVNGFMYWLNWLWTDVISFDFEREKFGNVALPAELQDERFRDKQYKSVGVLDGFLCLSCNDFYSQRIYLWVMRKCGNQDSWRKEFVIDMSRPTVGSIYGVLKPLQLLRNGEILMLRMRRDLVCYDPRTETLRYVGLNRLRRSHKPVALTPTFVPLNDTLKVENVLRLRRYRANW